MIRCICGKLFQPQNDLPDAGFFQCPDCTPKVGDTQIDLLRRAMTQLQYTYYPMSDEPFRILEIVPSVDVPGVTEGEGEGITHEVAMELLLAGQFLELTFRSGGMWARMSKEEWESLDRPGVGRYVWNEEEEKKDVLHA